MPVLTPRKVRAMGKETPQIPSPDAETVAIAVVLVTAIVIALDWQRHVFLRPGHIYQIADRRSRLRDSETATYCKTSSQPL